MKAEDDVIALAITGASGLQYGLRLLECLLAEPRTVYLMVSKPARVVAGLEMDLNLPSRPAELGRALQEYIGQSAGRLEIFSQDQWTAPVASGSAKVRAMVICPCSTSTLSAVATGASNSLIERAADVTLKEGRKLVMVVRETPLSVIHLENMLRLARMGAVMLPANPGFYHRPDSVASLVDFVVARVLDQLDVPHRLLAPWGQNPEH